MSREERFLAFILKVSTEAMDVDNNSYYEFGLAVIIRLNELIEKGQKRARHKLNMDVLSYLPPGTSLAVAKDKIKKVRKMYDIFNAIGPFRIHWIRTFSVDQISTFKDDINFIKTKFPKHGTP
ncbi:3360_t:CDS:2 [Gigaspora margarita]|uniref:3360_t:CDS:1 n=1 Tax=Gigaspora margarita TaxID=4874 RepID=A0ABN7WCW9_GIGMA|nr:3360_t:CDS:2 [Gigaspora margarita]